VFETYVLALAGVDQCPEGAPQEVKDRLAEDVERAEKAFADAAADGLLRSSADMERALADLVDANAASRDGLHQAKQIGALMRDLEKATRLALSVLTAASAI
jgi:hypothetical protein